MNVLGGIVSQCDEPMMKECSSPSVIDTLKRRKTSLTKQLGDVEAALQALEQNPKIMEVLELLARCR